MKKENNSLYQLCEIIVQTGKLDEDSIRQLAEYINNDPKASECWPGNKLLGPLKKVWEDGVVDQSELYLLKMALENIVNNPEKTPNEITAIESLHEIKEVKTDAERARGGCWMTIFICLIISTAALWISGNKLYIFSLIFTILLGVFFTLVKTLGVGGPSGRSGGLEALEAAEAVEEEIEIHTNHNRNCVVGGVLYPKWIPTRFGYIESVFD